MRKYESRINFEWKKKIKYVYFVGKKDKITNMNQYVDIVHRDKEKS